MRQIAGNDTKPYVLVLHAHSKCAPRCERHVGWGGLVSHRHLDGLAEDAVFQEELLSERLHLVAHNAVVVVARLRVSWRRRPHNGIPCVPVSPCQAHHRSQYRGADGSSSQDEEANVEDVHQAVGRRHNTQSHEGNKAQLSCTHVQVILLIRQRLHWFRCPGCGARVGH